MNKTFVVKNSSNDTQIKMPTSINSIRKKYIPLQGKNIQKIAIPTINKLLETKYVYHFDWMGVPTIQFPSDLIVMQEIIYKYRPDVIIETGVAHGGSLLFYSSILRLIKKKFMVIGIDILIKKKNKQRLLLNKLSKHIKLFVGSSIDLKIFEKVKKFANKKKVIVILDSNHSHEHVLSELKIFSKLIKKNGYLIVMDTTTEYVQKKHINKNRNFGKGNNPLTAVRQFLKENNTFIVDKLYENKSFLSGCFNGFLKKK